MDPYKLQADVLKALAHPVRLRILEVLDREEACVCHLTTLLRRRQPYISQHLMILRAAGIVQDRKEGPIVYYRLADPRLLEMLGPLRAWLRANGAHVDVPPLPKPPLAGCPCPKCGRLADRNV